MYKQILVLLGGFLLMFHLSAQTQTAYPGKRTLLPNGWSITPAGRQIAIGDFPIAMTLSPDGALLAVAHAGVGLQYVQLFDAKTGAPLDSLTVNKLWYGLVFSADSKRLYASAGTDNSVEVFRLANHKLVRDSVIRLGKPMKNNDVFAAGLALDAVHNRLFACTMGDSMLHVVNLKTQKVEQHIALPNEPYACAYNAQTNEVYASLWGGKTVAVFDANTLRRKADLPAGLHPNEMLVSPDGSRLFVANALDNSVSVIDLKTGREQEVLNAALYPNAPNGSTTNSLALSADQRTLYIANADNNCLAVYDVSVVGESRSRGFIPTGWYPTSVRVSGNSIWVTNGKGISSVANPGGIQPNMSESEARSHASQYIGAAIFGGLSVIETPDNTILADYSRQVYANTPYSKEKETLAEGEVGNPVPMRVGDPSPIKYVFYIIKENRTYDQVLGDMPEGNGDPALCLFPEKVTPNHHALAREFVLLDNFYVDAEVSADGHNWSMGAYANDYVEKKWPTEYGGRGGQYDYEGDNPLAHPKSGYFWDLCKRAGLSYRTYGEFADNYKPNYPTIDGHFCTTYSAWDMNIQDIERERVWERDFDSLLAVGQVPRFSSLRLTNDHTSGMEKGAYSPFAAVADNDLAFGNFIEHLSKSPIWKESVVFVLEDDAQDGPDHIDAHRSIAFVVGPYVKRGFIDHTMYSTSSMLRTMELILGLPPMSQFDAAATPMWRCFTAVPDVRPYTTRPNQVPIDTRNAYIDNELTRRSAAFDLSQVDRVPERAFNEVLWKAIRGMDSEMPAPRRAAWVVE
jgi:YVTN family beta-propeller protein